LALNAIAWALAGLGKLQDAHAVAERAASLSPGFEFRIF
jgi:hypothetical protein